MVSGIYVFVSIVSWYYEQEILPFAFFSWATNHAGISANSISNDIYAKIVLTSSVIEADEVIRYSS